MSCLNDGVINNDRSTTLQKLLSNINIRGVRGGHFQLKFDGPKLEPVSLNVSHAETFSAPPEAFTTAFPRMGLLLMKSFLRHYLLAFKEHLDGHPVQSVTKNWKRRFGRLIVQEHPHFSMREVNSLVSEMWQKVGIEDRRMYQQQPKEDFENCIENYHTLNREH